MSLFISGVLAAVFRFRHIGLALIGVLAVASCVDKARGPIEPIPPIPPIGTKSNQEACAYVNYDPKVLVYTDRSGFFRLVANGPWVKTGTNGGVATVRGRKVGSDVHSCAKYKPKP